jgi:RNA polymerase sigma-70 factor (ECF subfamily)
LDDPERYDQLYVDSSKRLVAQVAALTGDVHEAVDCVQEAFIRAWIHWNRISEYENPEAWVRRVSYRLAIGSWRRRRRLILKAAVPSAVAEGSSFELIEAISALDARYRQVIVLHHFVGLSVEEVSMELSRPSGTIKSWLARGRAQLAELINVDEEVERAP